jgi:hypothetical protein
MLYNPYPDYNHAPWNTTNKGRYVPCDGPNGKLGEVLVFSGHPEHFTTAPMGSNIPLDIDGNLCFERETRLGAYGYVEEGSTSSYSVRNEQGKVDSDAANWGQLQDYCVAKNSDRYVALEEMPHISGNSAKSRGPEGTSKTNTGKVESEKGEVKPKARTALLLRSWTGKNYTENDKQMIRSLVTELSLRSGGEYHVYLLVQVKEEGLPIWTDPAVYDKTIRDNVPKEFWHMTILWNDAVMREWYPLISLKYSNVHQAQWLSVQKFAQEHPEFDYFWNWELDTRYTGHHYNLLEKLASFAEKQPRKGLWERNERYYIPSLHGDYDTTFRKTVENLIESKYVWGPVEVANTTAVGPTPPTTYEKDNYSWGVDEEADYITLAPIFDPVNTNWIGRFHVIGYGGRNTPRRATIGTQSRCSRKLLEVMHDENKKGNHVISEMTPQTVAFLHGFKAVYAPLPIYFDRAWKGQSLDKWFNPCPRGGSGGCQESSFGWGLEGRFAGSTWYYRAVPPMRLYNNWMGWEDSGMGGAEVCSL